MSAADQEGFSSAMKLFHRLCDWTPEQQATELTSLRAHNAPLCDEVEALLRADRESEHPLDGRALDALTGMLAPGAAQDDRQLPKAIGEFEILGVLGEGGMGIVFEAQQHAPKRVVALKLLRPGWMDSERMRRFEHEASVLASLSHPGIAQIYSAGTAQVHSSDTEPGTGGVQPYIAMELVRGRRIDDYVAREELSVGQRLALMAELCDAVQHAHQKGVVHRDLKPANVLVTEEGRVKILDFGVARITDSDVEAMTRRTAVGELLGTLPYMSPEQVAGDPTQVDTRSDVYALGVLAYELLVGHRPLDVTRRSLAEAARVIAEEEPSGLGHVDRRLRGDVETIVAKALEKNKERRYGSAEEFGKDLRRHLADEPIRARAPSRRYQLAKFTRRNRGLVAALVLAFAVLLGGTVLSTHLFLRSQQSLVRAEEAERQWKSAADQARIEASVAREVSDFLVSLFEVSDPSGSAGARMTGRQLLDRGRVQIEEQLADQPAVRAELLNTMGRVYFNLGQYEVSKPLLEETIATLRASAAPDGLQLATALFSLGEILHYQGALREIGTLYEDALALREAELPPGDLLIATTIDVIGRHHRDLGGAENLASAKELALRAQRMRLDAGAGPMDLSESLQSLAALAGGTGNLDESETLYMEALAMREELAGTGTNPQAAFRVPELRHALGRLCIRREEFKQAQLHFQRSLEESREVFGPQHVFVAHNLLGMASAYRGLGQLEQTEELLREALELISDQDRSLARLIRLELAFLLHDRGDLDGAEEHYRGLLEENVLALGEDHKTTAIYRGNLATLLMDRGQFDEATALLEAAIGTYRDGATAGSHLAIALRNLSVCLTRSGQYAEALAHGREAVELASSIFGEGSSMHGAALRALRSTELEAARSR